MCMSYYRIGGSISYKTASSTTCVVFPLSKCVPYGRFDLLQMTQQVSHLHICTCTVYLQTKRLSISTVNYVAAITVKQHDECWKACTEDYIISGIME